MNEINIPQPIFSQDAALENLWGLLDDAWGAGEDMEEEVPESDPSVPPNDPHDPNPLAIEDGNPESDQHDNDDTPIESSPVYPVLVDNYYGFSSDSDNESIPATQVDPDEAISAPATPAAANPSASSASMGDDPAEVRKAEVLAKLAALKTGFENTVLSYV